MKRLPLLVMGGTLRQVRDRLCRCSCVAEISAAYTAAFDMVWPSVKGGSMSFQELKQRHRQERDAQHSNLRLRVHRALSWLDRAEQAEDLDGRFIFLWIAFNAAYATEIDDQQRLSEQETFKAFLQKLCTLDKAKRIDALVWQEFSGNIRVLLDSKRSINPALADGFVFRKQRQKLVSSSTAAALRNPRRSSPLAGVQGCGAARRKALARWLWQFRSGCRSALWPLHPWACP